MIRTFWKGSNLIERSQCGKMLRKVFSTSLCESCEQSRDFFSHDTNLATTPFRSEFLWNPDAKTVYVHTFGCSHNISDGETMKGVLAQGGYNITTKKEEADVWVINTCTVRDKSIQSFRTLYKEAKKSGKKLVVAGCMLEADPSLSSEFCADATIGVRQIAHIKDTIDSLYTHESRTLSSNEIPSLQLPKIRKDEAVEIIPISLGCLGACTFCQTRLARGKLRSYPVDEILKRVHNSKVNGISEIWLTSEDTGAYGIDRGSSLIELLDQIRSEVENSNVMVKIGMTNPPFLKPVLQPLANILNHKNFYSYLHIPVQSGSDAVLKRMNRKYQVADFTEICSFLTQHVPDITLSTDIIVGFPYETAEDHAKTMQLLRDLNLNIVHYSRYYPRPHTLAARYEQLPMDVVKSRVKELSDWFKALHPYDELVGKEMTVWVSNEKTGNFRCCHSKNYTKVLIEDSPKFVAGDILKVQCVNAQRFHVKAKIVDKEMVETK